MAGLDEAPAMEGIQVLPNRNLGQIEYFRQTRNEHAAISLQER